MIRTIFLKLSVTIVFIGLFFSVAKSQVDSLEKVVKQQHGKDKVLTLCELSFQLSTIQLNKAISYGYQALEESKKTSDSLLIAQAMNDLSIAYLRKGNYDSVLILNKAAYTIRNARNEKALAAASLAKIGQAYYELGNIEEALKYNLKALSYYESVNDKARSALVANNIGSQYEKNGNLAEAAKWYKQSIELSEKLENKNSYYTAKINYATLIKKQGKIKESEQVLLAMLPELEKEGLNEQLCVIYQALGVNYRLQNKTKEGLKYYLKTLDIYRAIQSDIGIATILINIGNTYTDLGDYSKAESSLMEALGIIKKIGSYSSLYEVYSKLYFLEKVRKNYTKALDYIELANAAHDSVYTAESNGTILKLNAKYQSEKKEKELLLTNTALAESKAANSLKNMWITIIAALVVLLSAFIVIIRLRYKNRQNKLESEARLELSNERLRISRDLHDNLGAELTWISSELDTKAYTIENKKLQQEFGGLADKTRSAIKSLRETIWAIHNENITPQQILSRIKEQSKSVLESKGIQLEVRTSTIEPELGPKYILHFHRICQEGLNNAIKYSGCSKIAISFDYNENLRQLTLSITDNGKGFDLNTVDKGYGLNNIEQRSKEMGGFCKIESSRTSGTIIEVKVKV